MGEIHLKIVTPDGSFFDDQVDSLIVRGLEGDLAILKGRAPIVTPLKIGKVRIFQNDVEKVAAVTDGYISSANNNITIVTDAAEWPDEIDVKRAEEAKKKAEELLNRKEGTDVIRAQAALKRSLNRLETSKYK